MASIDSVSSSRETFGHSLALQGSQIVEGDSPVFEMFALLNPRLSRQNLRKARDHFLAAVHTLVELDRLSRSLKEEGEEKA